MSTTPKTAPDERKSATVALFSLDEPTAGVLRDCFRQFGIRTEAVVGDAVERLHKQKFEACVLRLNEEAEAILQAARGSPSNRRIVVYGISRGPEEAIRYSKYGVNAMLQEPVDRQSALKVVRATHLLVINELRIYVRVPVFTELAIERAGRKFTASTLEVSAGGMSLRCPEKMALGENVEVGFTLPGEKPLKLGATVVWRRDPDVIGLRFEPGDERRIAVRQWIDTYLGIG
ncbi:MAG TPA: PilZ domain-containing protein [Terriglobales bacterium]|nr:PilZ domain-containing protein [Terriglobales bacterium]